MTNHVPTVETCQRLKAAGFPQDSIEFLWCRHKLDERYLPYTQYRPASSKEHVISAAPLLTELLELMPASKVTITRHDENR